MCRSGVRGTASTSTSSRNTTSARTTPLSWWPVLRERIMPPSVMSLVQPNLDGSPPIPGEHAHLVELLKRFEAIVNISTDFFTLIDSQHTYLAVNDAYCRAHGRPREHIIGHSVAELWGPEVYQLHLRPQLERCLAPNETPRQ